VLENFRIGIDIIDISRFQEKIFEHNKSFYEKIFNSSEIKYCLDKKNPYESFATKFAIKESVIKCLNNPINFLDISTNHENKKPTVKLLNNSSYHFLVSVSHEKSYAVAVVICELI
jgi:phosphopantetheine--protein transferase-like protein